jgi:glycosyltransferase involved in cell wall biosynthesis
VKILWLNSGFLHPTTRGGQIRTLEMLRRLRTRHEIHYLAFHDGEPEALQRSSEYSSKAWPVPHVSATRTSLRFWVETAQSLFSKLPVAIARKRSRAAKALIDKLLREEDFDIVVSDFLQPAINLPPGQPFFLFEHNVETVIWQRHAEQAPDPIQRAFFRGQAERMLAFERASCQRALHVVAVSDDDAAQLLELCGTANVSVIPTGVDAEYFFRPNARPTAARSTTTLPSTAPAATALSADGPANVEADLLFIGSMDWMPNIDGISWFAREVLPLIRRRLPKCSVTIAGRRPSASIRSLAEADPLIRVTGTVDDIRPYLWSAKVSIVPIRIGSGTRLKIYEAMAAGAPVVSTTIGAEGLEISSPENIRIADTPEDFANACIELLENRAERDRQADAALRLVREKFSWEVVAQRFEEILHSSSK